ncbi:MAG: uroporphyrinogen decarboxylase [Candidatus Bipolaricaulia bacterium]
MNDRFLRACRCEPVDCTPVWFMRQAGRYLPEYKKLRQRYDLLTICHTPELCAQVTLLPVKKLKVDAAILFADIMLPLGAMGVDFELRENVGPIIHNAIRRASDVMRLRVLEPADLSFVPEAIRLLCRELDVPLIGFAGAPFTLASYLIEGGPSRDFAKTKSFMYCEREAWKVLMERLAQSVLQYLKAQIIAGAQAVQLFDSWVGCLSPEDYQEFVSPYVRQIFEGLRGMGMPAIHFAVGAGGLLELLKEAGGDVIGIDWRVPLDQAWARLSNGVAIQGNLDPAVLLGPWKLIERRALEVLRRAGGRPGHIFNLGHGVLPDTPVDNLRRLVEFVHEYTKRGGYDGQ